MLNNNTRIHSLLFQLCHIGFSHFNLVTGFHEFSNRRILLTGFFGNRMLRGNRDIGCSHQGIRSSGVHLNRFISSARESDLYTFRPSNPVALHGLDLFRPARQLIQEAK